ncbi:ABC transporter substrate-binding protein [Conexibacter woesei]|uniref:Periplasmic binding protein n=1 Tax=Conexibacter woesei (strain DSM 14684 / CCUG 47730 / CIP 108061 / JCM 11494 / NBRC 100937 / ID131577) TaxID=469383 RepID=D3F5H7_CONWI|nr:ABC transporter substrate-binding protein [Conexibacter woesei]ADB50644.1 periplasmic binding protein [Conexibacter woesei DSM 14684]
MTRLVSTLLALLSAALFVAGCGGGDDARSASTAGSSTTASSAAAADAFPVTVRHAQGTATIPGPPRRVVALGAADVQIARALGAELVGASTNDSSPDGQWLGVDPPLPGSVAKLPAIEPDIERIASLRPDLILITTAQPSYSRLYETLAKIAPVISYRKGLLEDSGDDLTRLIGAALGRSEQAEALIARSGRQLDAFAREHRELEGKRIVFGQHAARTTYLVVAATAPSTVAFERLGMRLPGSLAKLPVQAAPGIAVISEEKLGLLDAADYVVLGVASPAVGRTFLAGPVVSRLGITERGGIRFIDFNEATVLLAPNPAVTGTLLDLLQELLRER